MAPNTFSVVAERPKELLHPITTTWMVAGRVPHNNSVVDSGGVQPKLLVKELPYGHEGCQTGGRVWHSAVLLSQWILGLLDERRRELFLGKKVLELGSGTGFVGLHVASLGLADEVVLTDYDEVALENCKGNVAANQRDLPIRVELLNWEDFELDGPLQSEARKGVYDVLLAADCVYEDNIEEFASAVASNMAPDGVTLVVMRERDGSGSNLYQQSLCACCRSQELVAIKVDEFNVGASCFVQQQNGGDWGRMERAYDSGPTLQQTFVLIELRWRSE